MKHAREIKVGVLAAICLFLLFFGFNFLKGVNIFSPTNAYHGTFCHIHGLEEQAAVYIRGHRVGQVDAIHYDFTRDSSFCVDISVNKDIDLPQGTRMALIADGLLGGMAVELQLPENADGDNLSGDENAQSLVEKGAYLPTTYVPGLMESVQTELLAHIDDAVQNIDSLVAALQNQVEGNHIKQSLVNVERVSGDLTAVSSNLKRLMNNQVPSIVKTADTVVSNLNNVVAGIKEIDFKATVARVDTAVENANVVIAQISSQDGTLGQLLYNKSLYNHIDATVVSADSLLSDIKTHPKRYVHFSVFGKKDK